MVKKPLPPNSCSTKYSVDQIVGEPNIFGQPNTERKVDIYISPK